MNPRVEPVGARLNMRFGISVEKKILGAFVAGGALLIVAAWFAVASSRAYLDSDARGDQLRLAWSATAELFSTLQDAELGARVYAFAGDIASLQTYATSVGAIDGELHRLHALLGDDPEAAARVERLEGLIPEKLELLKAGVQARADYGADAARPIMQSVAGRALMSDIRSEIKSLHTIVEAKIKAEADRARASNDFAYRAILFLAIVVVIFFVAAYFVIVRDVRERRRLSNQLRREATHDPLTGLPNRRFFIEWLGYAIAQARRDNTRFGLLFIDLDGFKAVNDAHGHKAGDAALAEIARRIRDTAREGDVLVRLGGDEFALATPNAHDGRELRHLALRLRDCLADPARDPIADTPIGASIGIAFFPDDATDLAGLLSAADGAMYAAKRAGKSGYAFKVVA